MTIVNDAASDRGWHRFRPLFSALPGFALLILAAAPAYAQLEIKLGHVGEPGSLFQKSADEFARLANAKLVGKAKVITYGSSQLGGDNEMIQKLKLGTLDMALPSTVMSSQVDLLGIFEMPYMCWRCGRTAFVTSPTASGRSRFPAISPASSCACQRASGG